MPCPYIKMSGEVCNRPIGSFTLCGHHRERAASKPATPCAKCGKPTKREAGLCLGRSCGWNDYRRDLARRKKASLAKELANTRVATAEETAAKAAAKKTADDKKAATKKTADDKKAEDKKKADERAVAKAAARKKTIDDNKAATLNKKKAKIEEQLAQLTAHVV